MALEDTSLDSSSSMPCIFTLKIENGYRLNDNELVVSCHLPIPDEISDLGRDTMCPFHLSLNGTDGRGRMKDKWKHEDCDAFNAALLKLVEDANEESPLDLSGVAFPGAIDFRGKDLQHVLFRHASFKEKADFEGARFGDKARFEKATYRNRAIFKSAVFGELAVFGEVNFDSANFDEATFDRGAQFQNCTFKSFATFRNTTFGEMAQFWKSSFRALTSFEGANFGRNLQFGAVRFENTADFSNAVFHGSTSFSESRFGHHTSFNNVKFGSVNFKHVTFNHVYFPSAEFRDHADFTEAEFKLAADFDRAVFKKIPVGLSTNFPEGTTFSRTRFDDVAPDKPSLMPSSVTIIDKGSIYRDLRRAMERLGSREEQAMFFALEQRANRMAGKSRGSIRLLSFLYDLASEYGQNPVRSLMWLAGLGLFFFLVYMGIFFEITGKWLPAAVILFTVEQFVRPFAIWWGNYTPTDELRAVFDVYPFIVRCIVTIQSIAGIGLITLFILAIRRRFKMD